MSGNKSMEAWRGKRVRAIRRKHDPVSGQTGTVTHLSGDSEYESYFGVWVVWDNPAFSPKWVSIEDLRIEP